MVLTYTQYTLAEVARYAIGSSAESSVLHYLLFLVSFHDSRATQSSSLAARSCCTAYLNERIFLDTRSTVAHMYHPALKLEIYRTAESRLFTGENNARASHSYEGI